MRHEEALELIRRAVAPGGVWADLGAGMGTFTRALGELVGPDGTIWAVDRSEEAVRVLRGLELPGGGALHVREADFTRPPELPTLDGILMAERAPLRTGAGERTAPARGPSASRR